MPHGIPEREKLQKHTLKLYEGDFERLQSFYPENGASSIVRRVVRKHLQDLEKKLPRARLNVEAEL